MYQELKNIGTVITIASGKGGVGKTNLAVNLALSMARFDKRICLLDGDMGTANAEVLLNVNPEYSLLDVLEDKCELQEALVECQHQLNLLSGGTGLERLAELSAHEKKRFKEIIPLFKRFDTMIIDCSAGINRQVVDWMRYSTLPIIVSTSEPTSVTDAYALIKTHSRHSSQPLYLCMNKVKELDYGNKVFHKLKNIVGEQLNIPIKYFGSLPEDEKLQKSVSLQKTVFLSHPNSSFSQAIEHYAGKLTGQGSVTAQSKKNNNFEQASSLKQRKEEIEQSNTTKSSHESADKRLRELLNSAFNKRATDIHIEPLNNQYSIRLRIDGVLEPVQAMNKETALNLIQGIKYANSGQMEGKGLWQKGLLRMTSQDMQDTMVARVSLFSMQMGEAAVISFLEKDSDLKGIEDLGLSGSMPESIQERIISPFYGNFALIGPRSSGKTSTLYALLMACRGPGLKIVTAEDLIENQLERVSQTQVSFEDSDSLWWTFRELLLQDPDLIAMDGADSNHGLAEILDLARVGHKQFFTCTARYSSGFLHYLAGQDIKTRASLEPLQGILGQMLSRKLCQHCAKPYFPGNKEADLLKYHGFSPAENNWKKPTGCRHCNFSGYWGRTGVFEYLDLDEEFRDGLMQGCDLKSLKENLYNKSQAITLVSDALNKASQGLISLNEIINRIPYEKTKS